MDCNRWREMASEFIEETLPPAMREAMRRHAAECPTCRGDHAALIALSREMNVLPTVDPPLFFRENVMAAIERQKQVVPLWRQFLFGPEGTLAGAGPLRVARTAIGTLLIAGTVSAFGWSLLLPGLRGGGNTTNASIVAAPLAPLSELLPDGTSAATHQPLLRVTRVTTITPTSGPSYDLSFWLSNADRGVARWQFVGDPKSYTFPLSGSAPQTVRIPYTAAQGKDTLALSVHWTADAAGHTRTLILPVAQTTGANTSVAATPTPIAPHQSFGLPEESLTDAARDLSARYGVPITLDDVPEGLRVQITAEDETAQATLARHLKDAGLTATESAAGILVATGSGRAACGVRAIDYSSLPLEPLTPVPSPRASLLGRGESKINYCFLWRRR